MRKGIIKDFKAYLNAKFPGVAQGGQGSGKLGTKTGSTKRPYGDYLYSQDREMFMNDLQEALEKKEFS